MRRFRALQRVVQVDRLPQCPDGFVVALTLAGNLTCEKPFGNLQQVSFELVLLILAPSELLCKRDERLPLPFCAGQSPRGNQRQATSQPPGPLDKTKTFRRRRLAQQVFPAPKTDQGK